MISEAYTLGKNIRKKVRDENLRHFFKMIFVFRGDGNRYIMIIMESGSFRKGKCASG